MAISAREMLLIVRAQNLASGALRRVARDVRGLPDRRQLQLGRQQAQINLESARTSRQRMLDELRSVQQGPRRLANERRVLASQTAQLRTQAQQVRLTERQVREGGRLINQQRVGQQIAFRLAQAEALRQRVITGGGGRRGIGEEEFARRARERPLGREAAIAQRIAQLQQAQAANIAFTRSSEISARQLTMQSRLLRDSFQQQTLRVREATAATGQLDVRAGQLRQQLAVQAERIAIAEEKFNDYSAAIRDIPWQRMSAGGRILQHFGRVAEYVALASGAALGYAANAAAEFLTQGTLAATQVATSMGRGAAGVAVASRQISASLLQIMGQSTATSEEINKAAYDIYSSMTFQGGQAAQIRQGMNLMRLFNRAAIAGQADLQSVTHAGITIMNNFARQGMLAQDAPRLMNRMFAAVRYGRTTVTEFVGTLNQVAPAFSAAFGRSPETFDQLSGSLAALTRQMPSTRMASTALARLVEMFSRADFIRGLATFGVRITDSTGKLIPLEQILARLIQRFPEIQRGGVTLQNFYKTITAAGSETGRGGTMGTIQGRRALTLLIQNYQQYRQVNRQVINDNNEFIRSFNAMRGTPQVQLRMLINQIKQLAISIGVEAIPAIVDLFRPLARAVQWFNRLDEHTRRQIAHWAVYGTAIVAATGAISFMLGTVIRAVVGLRSFWNIGVASRLSIVALGAAILVVTGYFGGLDDIIVKLTDSWEGWVILLGTTAVVVLRVTRALIAMRDAQRGLAAAQAAGTAANLASGLSGAAGAGGRLAGAFRLLRVGGPWAIAAMLGVGYVAKSLREDAEAAADRLERLQASQRRFAELTHAPQLRAAQGDINGYVNAQRRMANQLPELQRKLVGFSTAIQLGRQGRLFSGDQQELRRQYGYTTAAIIMQARQQTDPLEWLQRQQKGVIGNYRDIQQASVRASNTARQATVSLIRAQFPHLPRRPAINRALQDAAQISLRLGRMLTRRELRLIIRAEIDPRARRQLPQWIQDIITRNRRARREARQLQRTQREIATADLESRRLGVRPGLGRRAVHGLFQPARVRQEMPRFQTVGMQIDQGIAAGITNNAHLIKDAVAKALIEAHVTAKVTIQAGSPSRLYAQLGRDTVLGYAQGIREASPLLRELSRNLSIDLMPDLEKTVRTARETGRKVGSRGKTALERSVDSALGLTGGRGGGATGARTTTRTVHLRLTAGRVLGQLRFQVNQLREFNRLMAQLRARGAPPALLRQLAEGGAQALPLIRQIAGMTRNQLQEYVGLWRQAYAQIDHASEQQAQKEKERRDRLRDQVRTAVENMRQAYDEMYDANQQAFGSITEGVRSMNQIDIGAIPTAADMLGDIKDQVRNFERWRGEISRASRVLPRGLVQELQKAGPQAEPFLRALLGMTPRQRAQYIAMWKRGQRDIRAATRIDFNLQLRDWRRHGRRAARLFMLGMRDEQSWINRQMRRIFLSFLTPQQRRALGTRATAGHTTHVKNDNSLHVYNPKEDLRTTVRKANFTKKQKARRR